MESGIHWVEAEGSVSDESKLLSCFFSFPGCFFSPTYKDITMASFSQLLERNKIFG